MRNTAFVEHNIYFGIISPIQIQKIRFNIFLEAFAMEELTEYTAISLIIDILDICSIKKS